MLLHLADVRASVAQAWPPFVLVAGLLLIGQLAGRDGLFDAAASRLVAMPGPPVALLGACFGLVLVVSALLNLDTSAVFLTPVLVKTAQRRGLDLDPFLYGAIFMANASSLFLVGSNLTNLLVLAGTHTSGVEFFARMLPAALIAPLITAAALIVIHRRVLFLDSPVSESPSVEPIRLGVGLLGAIVAAALMVALANPALPVLGLALALVCWRALRDDASLPGRSLRELGAPVLIGLFALSVLLGTLARTSSFPTDLLHSPSALGTSVLAALSSVLVNNLPAAVLLSSSGHLHSGPLLIGLNVGPNLVVSGSLAVLLWWRAARAAGASPSALAYSRQGLVLAPLALLGAVLLGSG